MYANDPRIIEAKFNSFCAETGKQIKKGDKCLFYPIGKKVYTLDSDQAKDYYSWKADIQNGYEY